MNKRIEIEIDGEVFEAKLLEEEAPETCKAILSVLPMENEVCQARYSGGVLVFETSNLFPPKVTQENGTIYASQGDVLFIDSRTFTNNYDLKDRIGGGCQEFFIAYDKRCTQINTSSRGWCCCTLFAKITENLDNLQKVGERVWKTGVKKVIIR